MEIFDSEPVDMSALSGRSNQDKKEMAREMMLHIDGNDEAAIQEFKERWNMTDKEFLVLNTAIDVAKVMAVWASAENPDEPSAEEAEIIQDRILDFLDSLSAERVTALFMIMSYYAFGYAKSQGGI